MEDIKEDVKVKPVKEPVVHISSLNTPSVDCLLPSVRNPFLELREHQQKIFNIKVKKPFGLSSGAGRKQGTQGLYKGIEFDSKWEYAYYRWATEIKNWSVTRNTSDFFNYRDAEGKNKKFYPDFKCNGNYVEVKGIYRENDVLKRNATLGKVQFIGPTEIKPIIKELKERIPKWLDDFTEHKHKTHLGKPKI